MMCCADRLILRIKRSNWKLAWEPGNIGLRFAYLFASPFDCMKESQMYHFPGSDPSISNPKGTALTRNS